MNLTIAVIAKECSPGKVKTRLTPPLTPEQAAALAQTSLSQTLETVRSLPADRRLLVFDGTPHERDAAGFEVSAQCSGGLDERLAAICSLTAGPLLILAWTRPKYAGSNWPRSWRTGSPRSGTASRRVVRPGVGRWLLGVGPVPARRRFAPRGGHVHSADRAQQLARLAGAGLEVGLLPVVRDVDYFADALAAARECSGTRFALAVERFGVGLPEAGMPLGVPAGVVPTWGSSR
ncbi:conserved hypothetical protein [Arthrobacter sp. Hiyo8]|nr:conserved hypothetical protein [Arthrobacter sp. Hiyo8]